VKVLAKGKDPGSTKAGELGQGDAQTVTIGAERLGRRGASHDDRAQGAPATGDRRPRLRRDHQPGRNIATNIEEKKVGDLVEAISAAP
jgi:hypothetical protein